MPRTKETKGRRFSRVMLTVKNISAAPLNITASVLSINTIVKQPIAFIAKGGSISRVCFTM